MLGRLLNCITCPFYKTKWTFHLPRRKPDKPLQVPFLNWKIVKGDMVKVRSGDDKGKIGKVLKVLRKLNRVVVRKVNMNYYTKSSHLLI